MEKVKINWSYYKLPGFKKAEDDNGYVPCLECLRKMEWEELIEDCDHGR